MGGDDDLRGFPRPEPMTWPDMRMRPSPVQKLQPDSDVEEDSNSDVPGGRVQVEPVFRWSAGAADHKSGVCRPCRYMHTRNGCGSGASCVFCHLAHDKRHRPCKAKRTRCKRATVALDIAAATGGQPRLESVAHELASQSGYMRYVVESKLNSYQEKKDTSILVHL